MSGGVSTLVFGVRMLLEVRGDFEVVVKLDMSNGFNAVSSPTAADPNRSPRRDQKLGNPSDDLYIHRVSIDYCVGILIT